MSNYEYRSNNEAHTAEYYDQYSNTISNGEARIPICFCIDTSQSMKNIIGGQYVEIPGTERYVDGQRVIDVKPKYPGQELLSRIKQLRIVLNKMIEKMKNNTTISNSAVICVITFDRFADCFADFRDVSRIPYNFANNINIGADQTNVSKALQMALERIDEQLYINSSAGNDSYRPVLIFLSDGIPTDGSEAVRLRNIVRERSENEKLNVIPIGIGKGVDERWLRQLSRESKIYTMDDDIQFEKVFEIITRQIESIGTVIVTDENINLTNQCLDDTNSTVYGENVDYSFLSDFMNESF